MNRKQMTIGGIVLVLLIVLGVLAWRNLFAGSRSPAETGTNVPVLELTYCNGNQVKPCVVSFSVDSDGNMLINLLLPDVPFPDFYLKIAQANGDILYKCLRVKDSPNNAYCTGEKLPPGVAMHLMILSSDDDTLLADGTLPIIGLAFPTLGIVTPTFANTPTELPATLTTASPTPTMISKKVTPKPTQTKPSYPNPSPSYP